MGGIQGNPDERCAPRRELTGPRAPQADGKGNEERHDEGTLVSAEEARGMGLVDFVVPRQRLRAEVQAYGAALAGKPSEALAAIRRSITTGLELSYEDALALELEEAVRLAGTPDFSEGLAAFLQKRPPKWQ